MKVSLFMSRWYCENIAIYVKVIDSLSLVSERYSLTLSLSLSLIFSLSSGSQLIVEGVCVKNSDIAMYVNVTLWKYRYLCQGDRFSLSREREILSLSFSLSLSLCLSRQSAPCHMCVSLSHTHIISHSPVPGVCLSLSLYLAFSLSHFGQL